MRQIWTRKYNEGWVQVYHSDVLKEGWVLCKGDGHFGEG